MEDRKHDRASGAATPDRADPYAFANHNNATQRPIRQGLVRVLGGVLVRAGDRFLAYRAGPAGLVQVGGIFDSLAAAIAAVGAR